MPSRADYEAWKRLEEYRRDALTREAAERAEVSHISEAGRLLRRAKEVLGPEYRRIHSLEKLKGSARKHIASARAIRTLIGPPKPICYEFF